jgi:long-subunit fatty acid transport protein
MKTQLTSPLIHSWLFLWFLFVSHESLCLPNKNSFQLLNQIGDIKIKSPQNTDQTNIHILSVQAQFSYEYYLNDLVSFGVGYLAGSNRGDIADFFGITDSYIRYKSYLLNTKLLLPINRSNAFYLALNYNHYNFDVFDDEIIVQRNSDFGWGTSIGWMYKFAFGLGLDLRIQEQIHFGSDMKLNMFGFGASYEF